jgi:hypothetical protein
MAHKEHLVSGCASLQIIEAVEPGATTMRDIYKHNNRGICKLLVFTANSRMCEL